MLRGILTDAVTREPDMQLLSHEPPTDDRLAVLQPDVVVCGAEDAFEITRPQALLRLLPRASVLMMANSGRQGVLFELRPTRLTLREVSMAGVIGAIRDVQRTEPERWRALLLDQGSSAVGSRHPRGGAPGPVSRHEPPPAQTPPGRLTWREKP